MPRRIPGESPIFGTNEITAPGIDAGREITKPAQPTMREEATEPGRKAVEILGIGNKVPMRRSSGEWQECKIIEIDKTGSVQLKNLTTGENFFYDEQDILQWKKEKRVYDLSQKHMYFEIRVGGKIQKCSVDEDAIGEKIRFTYFDDGVRNDVIGIDEFLALVEEKNEV